MCTYLAVVQVYYIIHIINVSMQLVQYYSVYLCTSAGPPVSIEAEATIAFTPVATNGVHTAMVAVVGALAFIDICM